MKFSTFATAAALFCGLGFNAAHAVTIINLDATKGTGPWGQETDAATVTKSFDAGSYTVSIIDNTANGGYAGYNYNTGTTIREAFDFKIGNGPLLSVDVSPTGFSSYVNTGAALTAFSTGPYYFYTANGSKYDASVVGSQQGLTLTFSGPTSVTFGIPDNMFGDNQKGVSLAITAAVPEPETYALMLAGLGALGFMSRRRNER